MDIQTYRYTHRCTDIQIYSIHITHRYNDIQIYTWIYRHTHRYTERTVYMKRAVITIGILFYPEEAQSIYPV